MSTCWRCHRTNLSRAIDLGKVPAAQHYPFATEAVSPEEWSNPLASDLCIRYVIAHLAHDDAAVTAELRRIGAAATAGEGIVR